MFNFSAARNILKPCIVTVKNPRFRASCRELCASNQLFWKVSCLPRQLSTSKRELHDEPLRILYCGSDAFSCTPLEALHQESQRPASNIASIDVVCREGKPYGRGLKSVRHPQIKDLAMSLGIPVHQIKTFTGWELPEYHNANASKINLVIAVSFGLFIPSRILSASRFSGVNLHPSLLPEYKGPAPLHWTILNGEERTGMSLQTLHPTSFDEGIILDQTPWPGIVVPDKCDYQTLLEIMQPLGAEMLVKAIRKRLYLPPLHAVGWAGKVDNAKTMYKHAPKIETAHKLLCFERMDSSHILRMSRAFESTWAFAAAAPQRSKIKRQRIIFQGPLSIRSTPSTILEDNMSVPEVPPGLPYWRTDAMNDEKENTTLPLLVNTIDGNTISADYLKVEGGVKMPAQRAALKHRLTRQQRDLNSRSVITFHETLTSAP